MTEDNNKQQQEPKKPLPNLFQGRPEVEEANSKYPEWDIVPPDQFINPRIKQQ